MPSNLTLLKNRDFLNQNNGKIIERSTLLERRRKYPALSPEDYDYLETIRRLKNAPEPQRGPPTYSVAMLWTDQLFIAALFVGCVTFWAWLIGKVI